MGSMDTGQGLAAAQRATGHGSAACYRQGCRLPPCKQAHAKRIKAQRRRRAERVKAESQARRLARDIARNAAMIREANSRASEPTAMDLIRRQRELDNVPEYLPDPEPYDYRAALAQITSQAATTLPLRASQPGPAAKGQPRQRRPVAAQPARQPQPRPQTHASAGAPVCEVCGNSAIYMVGNSIRCETHLNA